MDRSLEEIISERPARGGGNSRDTRRPAPPRAPRREEGPRDGVRKYRRDEPQERERYVDERANIDSDWVHDRYEDDRYDNTRRRPRAEEERYAPRGASGPSGSKIRVDNLHYDLTEDDLRELFERIGSITSVSLLYDRADRSQGTAYVVYRSAEDARQAVREFDGCNANGQPIRLTLMPSGPAPAAKGSLFDRIQAPPRSLFDRIQGGPERAPGGSDRRRRNRSESPRRSERLAPPDVDRYVPGGRRSRSPVQRRGTPRENGRRPGQKREEGGGGRGGRGGRRQRTDEGGHQIVGGRPRKTAEELDAEMEDYWGQKKGGTNESGATANTTSNQSGTGNTGSGDVEMDEIL